MTKQLYSCSLAELKLDSQRFHNKNDIKPWLSEKLREVAGLQIVIERSDTSKIVFKCKNNAKKEIVEAKTSNCKVASRRQITCPFRIRANFSHRSQWWALVVINDTHDHEIPGKGIPVSANSGERMNQGYSVNSGNGSSSMETINNNNRKIDSMEIDVLNNNMNNNINNISNINSNNIHNINNNINSNNNVRNIDHVSNVSYSPNGVNHIPINNNHNVNVNYSSHNSPTNINHGSNHNGAITHINNVSHSRYFESPTDNPAFVHNILNSDDPVSSSSHSTKSSSSDVFSLIGSSTTLNSTILSSHTTPRDNNNSIFSNGLDESFSPSNAILNSSPKRKRPSGSIGGFKSKRVSDIQKSSPKIKSLSSSEIVMLESSTAGTRNNNIANSCSSTSTKRAKQMDDITSMMRNEINSIIQLHLINNKSLKKDQKSAVLDSLMSQLVVDQELLNKQLFNPFEKSHSSKRTQTVDHSLVKSREVEHVSPLSNSNHLSSKKSALSNWLNNPNQVHTMGGNPSANLIPLSPLLNDSDTEYNSSNTTSLNNTIDNSTHLSQNITPTNVMSVVNSHSLSNFSNFVAPSQVSQIQNQNQQLPSFNSIQHKLPLSPGGSGGVTSSSGVSSALIPPISNSIPSTTLNPSHLLKSNTKSLIFNSGQPSSFLTETKNNSYFTNQLFSSSHTYGGGLGQFSTSSLLSGLSIPTAQLSTSANNNNNINNSSLAFVNSNIPTNVGSGSNRDNSSVGNTSNLSSSGIVNNVGNFSESGW